MLSEDKRLKILEDFQRGIGIKDLVRKYDVACNTVRNIVRGIRPKQLGRKRSTIDKEVRKTRRFIASEVKQGRRVAVKKIKSAYKMTCSTSTSQRILKRIGCRYRIVKKELPLTSRHKKKRLHFVHQHLIRE